MKTKFNKRVLWMMAAILICGTTTFTSCTNEDNPATPDLNVAEKIIGKWIMTDKNGQPIPTSGRLVYTFVSTTKALVSASLNSRPEVGSHWSGQLEADVSISGNNVTVSMNLDEHTTSVHNYTITAIDANEFTASDIVTITIDGNVIHTAENVFRFTKVTADYSAAIIGTWEGHCTSAGSVFDDGQEHRWQYNADGTYVYYVKDGDNWVPYEGNTLNEYFVDGNLLCTRWIDLGQENREWWEINIDGDKMTWTALRQNEDGTTFTATFEMKKVEMNLKEKIIGKWIETEINGKPALTNEKTIITFVSTTKAIGSEARIDFTPTAPRWNSHLDFDLKIEGNKLTTAGHPNDSVVLQKEYYITDITDTHFSADYKHNTLRNGEPINTTEQSIRCVKITANYEKSIIGLWECTGLSGIETYNDANARLEFATDGTYKYWQKNDFNVWLQISTREFQEYLVDGVLLCTRWKDQGDAELREWWEIESITNDEMTWKALRQNEEGENVVQRMTWKKVDN